MADIIENLEDDRDTISSEEIEKQFNKKYNLLAETAVTLRQSYINKLDVNQFLKIAISLDDNSLEVYELNNSSFQSICRLEGHDKKVTEVVFHPKNEFLLFSTSHDGSIKLWDIRIKGTCVKEFKEEEDSPIRPYECMDVADTGNIFCSGSQLVEDESYLVFWDPRLTNSLGAYWESHTEDITQVKFKPNTNSILASGAGDGLINIFNLQEEDEDSALDYSLNIGNSVEKLHWLSNEELSCITQSNDMQIWEASTGDLVKEYSRDKIARNIKRSRDDDCYVVDTFLLADGTKCVLTGSYGGNGNTLRSLSISGKRLIPCTDFVGNRQVVRCCRYDTHKNILITSGESGLISAWSAQDTGCMDTPVDGKDSKVRALRHRPY